MLCLIIRFRNLQANDEQEVCIAGQEPAKGQQWMSQAVLLSLDMTVNHIKQSYSVEVTLTQPIVGWVTTWLCLLLSL